MLEGDGRHFVDIHQTDWSTVDKNPKPKRTTKRPRAPARSRSRSQSSNPVAASSSVSVPASPSLQQQLRLPSLRDLFPPNFLQPQPYPQPRPIVTMPRRLEEDDEDDDYMPDDEYKPQSKRHKSLSRGVSREPPASDDLDAELQGDIELDAPFTAASYRPNPRRSATVAYDRISRTSRTSRQPHRAEEQGEEERPHAQQTRARRKLQQSHSIDEQTNPQNRVTNEANRTSRDVHLTSPEQQDPRRAPNSRLSSNAPVRPSPLSNMSRLRDVRLPPTELTAASGRPIRGAFARALDHPGNEEDVMSDFRPVRPPITPAEQRKQNLIMVLYRSIFDSKLKEFPCLMTFHPIPNTWEGPPAPHPSPAPPNPNSDSLNLNIPQRPEFDAFHERSLHSTLTMQTPYGGPSLPVPPLRYESYSFQNYPSTLRANGEFSVASDVFGQAVPSLRTTPKYHPSNEMTPEQLQRYHNDRRLFVKMKSAWVDNDKVLRLREKVGDESALQTLWEVAQVFKMRNPVNPDSQSIKWFVDTRDDIIRPRSPQRSQSATVVPDDNDEESDGNESNLDDLFQAAYDAMEAANEPEPMDIDEPEPEVEHEHEREPEREGTPMQAGNANDDVYAEVDELAPAARMLYHLERQQQLEQQQTHQASVSPNTHHAQNYNAHINTPKSQTEVGEDDQERQAQRAQSTGSVGRRVGINDLLN
ncbi:hypothetical protein B0T20DRAFT_355295 [Sordaria brevicollis]|uniref:Uncharacterized protein n=1 Tax=Sordaria brevicollis TaxID=83679 RepID=A0AAE0UBL4_SORBR|nr:hypothetical protein B0T20DRAFT_355295 [Sordaria brevicollis]